MIHNYFAIHSVLATTFLYFKESTEWKAVSNDINFISEMLKKKPTRHSMIFMYSYRRVSHLCCHYAIGLLCKTLKILLTHQLQAM